MGNSVRCEVASVSEQHISTSHSSFHSPVYFKFYLSLYLFLILPIIYRKKKSAPSNKLTISSIFEYSLPQVCRGPMPVTP